MQFRNPRVQRLRRLLARRDARAAEGAFVVEGPKLLAEARAGGAAIEAVYVDAAGLERFEADVPGWDGAVEVLASGVMSRIADAVAPQSVMAVVGTVETELATLRGATLLLVAAGVSDPGNAGTLLRAAWGSGAAGVVFCDGSVDVYNPKTVRASAGSVFHVPVVVGGDAVKVLGEISGWGVQRLGAVAEGGTAYDEVDLRLPTSFVVGNEAAGLTPSVIAATDGLVTIPMRSGAESLNVGVAASILCFEAARQRRRTGTLPRSSAETAPGSSAETAPGSTA